MRLSSEQKQPLEQIGLDMLYLALNALSLAGKSDTATAQLVRDAIEQADSELDAINTHIIAELAEAGYTPYLGKGRLPS